MHKAYLTLENGTVFQGQFFGKPADVTGEIVFTTGMNGFLETITDPSCFGQIVVQTFPLVGNYGVISSDFESDNIQAQAYIIKYPCQEPSNFRSEEALDTFFVRQGKVGLCGIDTRALTKIIRDNGVMAARISTNPLSKAEIVMLGEYVITNAVADVSCKKLTVHGNGEYRVALLDLGVCRSTIDALTARGCTVHVFPHNSTATEILAISPHGILLSSGPGNPDDVANKPIIETIRHLQQSELPMLGICLGHLLLAHANGYATEKLKFGHRGANQPVKEVATGKIYITAQNHGYVVTQNTEQVSFVNVNDNTIEGLDYGNAFSVQFRPGTGPKDTDFIYDRFVMEVVKNA